MPGVMVLMEILTANSIEPIEWQYSTGERPVLVECDDRCTYVCKYPYSQAVPYKLVSEFVGSIMARCWRLNTPETAFVNIQKSHWPLIEGRGYPLGVSYGSKLLPDVVDVTYAALQQVVPTADTTLGLLKIALFDLWIANEDRNANNANLLYSPVSKQLISIDYGCILNTAMYDYPLSQLTSTDSILSSDLFRVLSSSIKGEFPFVSRTAFEEVVAKCGSAVDFIMSNLPQSWNVPVELLQRKLNQLFELEWLNGVWENYTEILNENMGNAVEI